jgi:hypothetical protein
MTVWSKARRARRPMAMVVAASLALALPGCAEFSELISFDGSGESAAEVKAKAEKASLLEMTLTAGRYGAMLDQAREILNLPEHKDAAMFPSTAKDDRAQRLALANYQVRVTNEFLTDAARACKKRKVPANLRAHACKEPRKVPATLRSAVPLELPALSARNDEVGHVIMPWWEAVCAHAKKPRSGEAPACAIE